MGRSNRYSTQFKLNVLAELDENKESQNQIAKRYGIEHELIIYWRKSRDKIVRQYYLETGMLNEAGVIPGPRIPSGLEPREIIISSEDPMPMRISADDLKRQNKDLERKVSLLEDRVAVYEEYFRTIGLDVTNLEKKTASKPSRQPRSTGKDT